MSSFEYLSPVAVRSVITFKRAEMLAGGRGGRFEGTETPLITGMEASRGRWTLILQLRKTALHSRVLSRSDVGCA